MSIGGRVKEMRLKKNMTQASLGKRAGISTSVISDLEHGRLASNRKLSSIAAVLGVNALWLETGIGAPDHQMTNAVDTFKKYNKDTELVICLMESTDEIGRGKALYAVKEIVDLRKAMIKASQIPFDEARIQQVRSEIEQWKFSEDNQQSYPAAYPQHKSDSQK